MKEINCDGVIMPMPKAKIDKYFIALTWEDATDRLEVEIHGKSLLSWYGKQLGTKFLAGTELDLDTTITPELKEWLAKFYHLKA